jgi:hypothetical protein
LASRSKERSKFGSRFRVDAGGDDALRLLNLGAALEDEDSSATAGGSSSTSKYDRSRGATFHAE